MVTSPPDFQEVVALRGLVDGFIRERLQPKLDAIKGDDKNAPTKREQIAKKYARQRWLQKAAQNSAYLLLATHPEKGNHTSIKDALSINLEESICDAPWLVGTHLLLPSMHQDVAVKNAGALYVWNFLQSSYAGRTLFQRLIDREETVLNALSEDRDLANQLAKQFASIYERKREIASHTLAKQLYFPLTDGGYHLLAPLFPTALVHEVHIRLQEVREAAKAALIARHAGQAHSQGYSDYPHLAVRYLGGSKPQNISQLNSERGGANYLLASVPPVWADQSPQLPLRVMSVFDPRGLIGRDREVQAMAKALRHLLQSVSDRDSNAHAREKCVELVQAIIDCVLDRATALQCLNGGWSADSRCKLSWAQKQWLDRGALEATQEAYETRAAHTHAVGPRVPQPVATHWREPVADDFARWLHAITRTYKNRVGDAELFDWKRAFLELLP